MFGTKGLKEKPLVSPYLGYGIKNVKVNKFTIKEAQSGAKRIQAEVETPKVDVAGFTPDASATQGGQVGRVNFSNWFNSSSAYYAKMVEDFAMDLAILATKLLGESTEEGQEVVSKERDKFDTAMAACETLEDSVEVMNEYLTDQFFFLAITAEEYAKQDGGTGIILNRRRYGFCASEAEGIEKLKEFDKTNKYDYKPLEEASTAQEVEDATSDDVAETLDDDLPF